MHTKRIDFKKFSSIKIGGAHEVSIVEDISFLSNHYILGLANNILISDNPPPLMVLGKNFDYIKIDKDRLIIGCATPSGKIVSFCKKHNISGFEFLSHLPGTLGGIIKMNAGLKEFEIFNNLISVLTCEGIVEKKDIVHGYRYTDIKNVVYEASFHLTLGFDTTKIETFKKMRLNQPKEPSAGSCFKNPAGDYAGRLIEAAGLKGVRVGDMEFSKKHANFLINRGNGSYKDAIELIKLAEKEVYEKFGIKLEREIIVVDL